MERTLAYPSAYLRHSFIENPEEIDRETLLVQMKQRYEKSLKFERTWVGRYILPFLILSVSVFTIGLIIIPLTMWIHRTWNPIYTDERIGKGGRKFKCRKLRTMHDHPRDIVFTTGAAMQYANKQYTSKLGLILRKFGIDEIPQLWNIMEGTMGWCGTRPPSQQAMEQFWFYAPRDINSLPCITGPEQTSAIRDTGASTIEINVRYYRKQKSFLYDLQLIFWQTPLYVVFKKKPL